MRRHPLFPEAAPMARFHPEDWRSRPFDCASTVSHKISAQHKYNTNIKKGRRKEKKKPQVRSALTDGEKEFDR